MTQQHSHLHSRVLEAIKGIRQRQERSISFANDDLIKLLCELDNALGTEQTMHAAWRKRAEEAEGRIANQPTESPAEITEQDRARFPYHTDNAILGIKLIESLDSSALQRALGGGDDLESIRVQIGKNTNPNWVIARVADVLYNRGEMNEQEYDWITR